MKTILIILFGFIIININLYSQNCKLFAWGWNNYGQLGDGSKIDKLFPTQIGNDNNWKYISAGEFHCIAIKSDGTLWAWGQNFLGQLGDGTIQEKLIPTKIGNDKKWINISSGLAYNCGIKSDGTLWSWGFNDWGSLGDGTTSQKNYPVQIGNDNNWKKVSCGNSHTCAIKIDSSLWAWGSNPDGEIGNGTNLTQLSPTQIGVNDWKDVSSGYHFTIALKYNGTIWSWGRNSNSQLGDGTTSNKLFPSQIGLDNDWKFIAVGDGVSAAIKQNGTLWVWGVTYYDELGDESKLFSKIPIQVGKDNDWDKVYCGSYYIFAIKKNGTLWAWGNNIQGNLGDGTSINKHKPIQIINNIKWYMIALSHYQFQTYALVIISPQIASKQDIKFPQIVCENNSNQEFWLKNTGNAEMEINSADFTGVNFEEFQIISPKLPSKVNTGDSIKFVIEFNPKLPYGDKSAILTLHNNTFGEDSLWTINIYARKDSIGFRTDADTLNFGIVCPNSEKEMEFSVINNSTIRTLISNGNIEPPFEFSDKNIFATEFEINEKRTIKIKFTGTNKGKFSEKLIISDSCGNTKEITLKAEVFEAGITGNNVFCEGDSIVLQAEPQTGNNTYIWNTGETTSSINVKKAGKYTVTVINEFGCSDSSSIDIQTYPSFDAKISGNLLICEGTSTTLSAETNNSNYKYLWNTGDTSAEITVNKAGKYSVKITNENGCKASEEADVKNYPPPLIKILGNSSVCTGQTTELTATPGFVSYLWNTGETTEKINAKAGKYSLEITDLNGCKGYDTLDIKEIIFDLGQIDALDMGTICTGETANKEIIISPNSNEQIEIANIYLKSNSTSFKVIEPSVFPLIVNPNGILKISVNFNPIIPNKYEDSIILQFDKPCPATQTAYITGIGIAKTLVQVPDTSGAVNDPNFRIPIRTKLICGLDINQSLTFNTDLALAADIFVPSPNQSIISNSSINAGNRTLSLTNQVNNISYNWSEIGNIEGRIVLGSKDMTTLTITDFTYNNPYILTEIVNGSLSTFGLCIQNKSRLQYLIPTNLSISPNPSSNDIEISIENSQTGTIKLQVYDNLGKIIKTYSQNKNEQKTLFQINTIDYNSGIFRFNVILTGEQIANGMFVVER